MGTRHRALAPQGQRWRLAVSALVLSLPLLSVHAQDIEDDRDRGVRMLRDIRRELRNWYVDPTFGGLDLDAHFASVEAQIQAAASQAEISGRLAQALTVLRDSHTFFVPPPLSSNVEYGFVMRMIGDRCLVVAVKPGSLAEADGLRAGDTVLSIERVTPTRQNLHTIQYALNAVRPRSTLQMTVLSAAGARETKTIRAQRTSRRPYQRFEDWAALLVRRLENRDGQSVRTAVINDVLAARVASFDLTDEEVDDAFERARGKRGLILDLRGNPGGLVDSLRRVAGYLFERETTIGTMDGRKKAQPLKTIKRPADRLVRGPIVVLVDGASGSASEILARSLQIAGRAKIIGDRTAGAVMVSRLRAYTEGHEARFVLYGLSISESKLLMADGQSLEGTGVTPDEHVVPSPDDLAAGRDPVLARAAELLGVSIASSAAGRLFPRVWRE